MKALSSKSTSILYVDEATFYLDVALSEMLDDVDLSCNGIIHAIY